MGNDSLEEVFTAYDKVIKIWSPDGEELQRHMGVRVDPRKDTLEFKTVPAQFPIGTAVSGSVKVRI